MSTIRAALVMIISITVRDMSPALESVDYVEVSHDIIFNQQTELVQPVYIPLRNDDDCVEGNTFFSVDLFALMDRVDLGIDSVTITILDDDRE